MHVISRRKLRAFYTAHPVTRNPLEAWYKETRHAAWAAFHDVKAVFRHADVHRQFVIFDIGGNKYRLIAEINYRGQKVFIRHVLTHAEYDRGKWKPE